MGLDRDRNADDDQRPGDGGEEDVMGSTKLKIGLLVAGHLVAGLLLAWVVYGITHTAFVGLFALFIPQAGLTQYGGRP